MCKDGFAKHAASAGGKSVECLPVIPTPAATALVSEPSTAPTPQPTHPLYHYSKPLGVLAEPTECEAYGDDECAALSLSSKPLLCEVVRSDDAAVKLEEGRATTEDINTTSEKYRSVARQGSLLFFIISKQFIFN